jgi:aerobic carbon-monoxide dehydrogenase medium subunit
MKAPPFEYHAVSSLEETVALLGEYGDDAKVLAGGQSLVPLLALRLARPEHVVDINRVPAFGTIEDRDGLRVGPLVRQREAERSPTVRSANPLLAAALPFIGHTAIRNRGTVAGSIAHADPAAELPTVLTVLEGHVEATSKRGTRAIPASQLFQGFLTTDLASDELVSAVQFPPWTPGTGWSYQEFSRRSGDFAVVGVAVVLRLDEEGLIREGRIALAGVDATAVRANTAEVALAHQRPSEQLWASVAVEAAGDLRPPSDLHGSTPYRRHLAQTLIRRALREAHARTAAGR